MTATYDAFGKATVNAASTITNNLRFPGQYYDSETGLHYNWNRFYDPGTGRYVTEDPVGLGEKKNLYSYVPESNPIVAIDPMGLETFICHRPFKGRAKEGRISYHKYACVRDGRTGIMTCGSQTTDAFPGPSKGRPSTAADGDVFNSKTCRSVHPSEPCMDSCMAEVINDKNRPFYGWPTYGTDCKEWTIAAIAYCRKKCCLMNDYEKGLGGK